MTSGSYRPPRRWFADWQFGLALIAAPVFWALLYTLGQPLASPEWPMAQPSRFLLFALVYPVLEEVVFRGGVQPWWLRTTWGRRRIGGISVANIATSVVFSALHLIAHAPLWAVLVFVPSVLFGHFRDRHNTLAAPIALHVFYNAGYGWLFG